MTTNDKNDNSIKQPKSRRRTRTLGGKLLPICALLLCIAACFVAATAWVTVNKRAKSDGLEMTAETSPNLVIAADPDEVMDPDILTSGSPFRVTFDPNEGTYLPATHDDDYLAHNNDTQLRYVTNGKYVNMATGQAKEGKTLNVSNVEEGDDTRYHDYIVYIASAGQALADVALHATLTPTDAELTDTAKALSVDFYLDDEIGGEEVLVYCGTLNLAGYDVTQAQPYNAAGHTSIDLLTSCTIPCNEDGYIEILMRVYFDGALQKNATTAFINSVTLDTTPVGFTVSFSAD